MRISNIIAKWKNEYSSVWLNRFCMETLFCCLLIHHCSWFTLWVGRGAKNATFNMNLRFFRHQLVYPGRRARWFGQPLLGWMIYLNREIIIYYIHTEKYSPKSYVVNFRTQISSSQSEEQTTWFSRVKKMIRPIRIAKDVISHVRKMICPIRSDRGVRVSRQNSRLLLQLAAPLRTHSTRKVLLKEFFPLKKWKTFRKWSGIVSFVSLSIKKMVESRRLAKQQRKGINRTRRKPLLCFLSDLLCLSFKLKLVLKPAILLKFTHLRLCIENKQLRLLIVLELPYILTVIYVFNKRFYY